MSYVYAVLGSGRQGTAAAYDMARFGEAKQVVLADLDLEAAKRSAARVNRLLDRQVAHACRVDVTEPQQLEATLREVAVSPALYVEELRRRGFALRESFNAR